MLGNGIVVDSNLNLFTLLQACGVIKPFTNSNFYLIFGTETDIQGGPTRNGFFEFNILGTYSVATIDFDTSNFSKHADI